MLSFPWPSPFRLSRGTPVVMLIVIRPGVQINAIKRDALRADRNDRDVRAHVVVEAVLVHAEVCRRIVQSDEARRELRLRSVQGRHRAAQQNCGSDRLGMSCHSMPIMEREGKKVSQEYRGKCDRYSNGGSAEWKVFAAEGLNDVRFRRKSGETRVPHRRVLSSE